MKRKTTHAINSGEDSFLDIIANLVGVLIILVAVVGTQAKSVILMTAAEPDNTVALWQQQCAEADRAANLVESEIEDLQDQIAAERARATALAAIRHERLVALEMVKRSLEETTAAWDEHQQQALAWEQESRELHAQWESLERQAALLETDVSPEREVIQHYPTPIAKTVFSDEVHFRLAQGRLTYVPLDELVQLMRNEWKVKAEKLATAHRTSEVVGPIGDFRLHYELVAENVQRATQHGTVSQTLVRLDHFQITPTRTILGESIAEAWQPNSHFQRHLSRFAPHKTTVSVWVYPDSFSEYNQLRQWLRERGYQTASWPLSADRHISGSPDGLRTSAQ